MKNLPVWKVPAMLKVRHVLTYFAELGLTHGRTQSQEYLIKDNGGFEK